MNLRKIQVTILGEKDSGGNYKGNNYIIFICRINV